MLIDPPSHPPRGYMPFEIEVGGRRGWVCATPHADSTDDLCAPVWERDWVGDAADRLVPFVDYSGPLGGSRERILAMFDTQEQAVRACWEHAKSWWGGEPPDVQAVPQLRRRLPDGYRIFIEADPYRRMWLVRPDGTMLGECSGTSLSSAIDVYQKDAWREAGEASHQKQRVKEQERVRAWTDNEPPRRWVVLYDDDGSYRAPLAEEHCAEMRIYMPRAMMGDIETILRNCQGKRVGINGHFKQWIDEALRRLAVEALEKMNGDEGT